ncbi:hypothetical protein [Agaribacterium haliotis]|uniref:hypothetical protein n=1 Tax=Agaribacterium haliotis TaxID=2013869 RepID=UPI00117875E4|nr:hypothetical protein [Agaribacterium haliotis]
MQRYGDVWCAVCVGMLVFGMALFNSAAAKTETTTAITAAITLKPDSAELEAKTSLKPEAVNLQRAFYLQEVLGDLKGAALLYQHVAKHSKHKHLQAQALLRAAHCYSLIGANKQVASIHQRLLEDFAEFAQVQNVLQQSQSYLQQQGVELLPSPWRDGEVLEYESYDINGSLGKYTTRIKSELVSALGRQWKTENITVFAQKNEYRFEQSLSFDEANRFVSYQRHNFGRVLEALRANGTRISYDKPPNGISYEFEQNAAYLATDLVDILRRLPLHEHYRASLSLFDGGGVTAYRANIEVVDADVALEVPAGNFRAYQLKVTYVLNDIAVRDESYWIARDQRRLILQARQGELTTKLRNYRSAAAKQELAHVLSASLTINLPPRWLMYAVKSRALDGQNYVLLPFNGLSVAQYGINVAPRDNWQQVSLAELAEESIGWAEAYYLDYKLRPNSLSHIQLGDYSALRYQADYKTSYGDEVEDRSLFPNRQKKYTYHIVFYSSRQSAKIMQADHDYILDRLIKNK